MYDLGRRIVWYDLFIYFLFHFIRTRPLITSSPNMESHQHSLSSFTTISDMLPSLNLLFLFGPWSWFFVTSSAASPSSTKVSLALGRECDKILTPLLCSTICVHMTSSLTLASRRILGFISPRIKLKYIEVNPPSPGGNASLFWIRTCKCLWDEIVLLRCQTGA